MLRFTFSPDGSLPKHAPAKYPDVLESNGSFTITVDGRVFFTEPSFPIYEFLSQANEWMNGGRVPDSMEYASLETDENPLICFRRTVDDTFCLESPWAAFKCDSTFSFKEICKAVRELNDYIYGHRVLETIVSLLPDDGNLYDSSAFISVSKKN